ncbi:MAG: sugar transferase [Clostridia bacterium]|nr:sugar transferase [Clostridia bacterium]
MYRYVKRLLDIVLSSIGIIVLIIPMVVIGLIIVIDDPGPIFFKQKRIGIHKSEFLMWKFRTMKVSTPHDVPTHLLENPEQYITRAGKALRKFSLDELPQIFQILGNRLSIIGPRPALYTQADLISERDKYGANDIKPGLTGWAQINGRDELTISEKARFDGEYAKNVSFLFDCKCFFGTIAKVLNGDGIVEGRKDDMIKNNEPNREVIHHE